jgi:hypothetical protein
VRAVLLALTRRFEPTLDEATGSETAKNVNGTRARPGPDFMLCRCTCSCVLYGFASYCLIQSDSDVERHQRDHCSGLIAINRQPHVFFVHRLKSAVKSFLCRGVAGLATRAETTSDRSIIAQGVDFGRQ